MALMIAWICSASLMARYGVIEPGRVASSNPFRDFHERASHSHFRVRRRDEDHPPSQRARSNRERKMEAARQVVFRRTSRSASFMDARVDHELPSWRRPRAPRKWSGLYLREDGDDSRPVRHERG